MSAHTNEAIDSLAPSFPEPRPAAQFTPARRTGWLKLPKWLRAWWERETLRAELNQLSPRTLTDLGISRSDFPAIIAGTFTWDGEASDSNRR